MRLWLEANQGCELRRGTVGAPLEPMFRKCLWDKLLSQMVPTVGRDNTVLSFKILKVQRVERRWGNWSPCAVLEET